MRGLGVEKTIFYCSCDPQVRARGVPFGDARGAGRMNQLKNEVLRDPLTPNKIKIFLY